MLKPMTKLKPAQKDSSFADGRLSHVWRAVAARCIHHSTPVRTMPRAISGLGPVTAKRSYGAKLALSDICLSAQLAHYPQSP